MQERHLKIINEKLDVINRKLDSILALNEEQIPLSNNFLDLLPPFPLNSMAEFTKFCTDLNENEEMRKQFVSI